VNLRPARVAGSPDFRMLRNVLSNWAGFIVVSVVSFFLSPFVIHRLGDSAYGVWVLMASLTGYLGLLDLGVRSAITRYVARFHAQAHHSEAGLVASAALVIFLAAGVVAVCVPTFLAAYVDRLFQIPEDFRSSARIVLVLAGANIAVSLVGGIFAGVVVALQRFDLRNGVEVLQAGLRALATVLALSAGGGIVTLAVINLFFSVAAGVAYVWLSVRVYPGLRIRLTDCDRPHLRLVFSFSVYSFLLQVSAQLVFYSDAVVIGAFLPLNAITFFAIAGNLMNYSRGLISSISTTTSPLVSALEAANRDDEVREVLLRGARFATALILPISITFMLRGSSFIELWMGPQYAELSGRVLCVLNVALLFAAASQVASATLVGLGRHKILAAIGVLVGICNVALSIALVGPMGVVGVAWGTTIPDLATSLLFFPWYLRRTVGIAIQQYAVSTWLRPGVAAAPFALLSWALELLWPAGSLLEFSLQLLLTLPLAAAGNWFLCFSPAERRYYIRRFRDAWADGFR
jgi:O-antigen/teichoic acid export membrane protein